jgi:WD40 repeat protein
MPPLLRLFISSPGDVPNERLRADLIVDKLAQDYGRFFRLETYRWEHEPMIASGHFQDAIDPPSACDIVVLIVWSRLGTPLPESTAVREYRGLDGRAPVTGTEWEYEDALRAAREHGAPDILAFRNATPAQIDTLDADARRNSLAQLDALDAFWKRHFADRGVFLAAFDDYRSLEEFAVRLEESLRKLLERRIKALPADANAAGALWTGAPFRGLEAYEFEHEAIFFGRDGLVAQAAEQLTTQARAGTAFLLVSGASGSGKSSLVKAALAPRLMKRQRIQGIAFLRRAVFRPSDGGGDVILGLIEALTRDAAQDGVGLPELLAPGQKAADLAAYLRSAAGAPGFVFAGALGRLTEKARLGGRLLAFEEAKLILVVDQLEELFTRENIPAADRLLFVQLLGGLARSASVWVIATMRADFWHRAAETPELLSLAGGFGRIDIASPSPAELADMIRKPALAAGLSFEIHSERGLGLDAILAERASAEPGVLPLLSFTLDALYSQDVIKAGGRVLTFQTYDALGGLEGAITSRADEIVAGLPEAAQKSVPRVLRALTTMSTGADPVSVARSAPLASFPPGSDARAVIEAFTAARLVVASSERMIPVVRLAHEALISRWRRAKEQLASDRRDLETRSLIERQYARWDAAPDRAKTLLLLRDPDLANALDLSRRWGDELSPDLRAFIGRSDQAAKAAARRRWAAAAAVMFCLAALAIASIGALVIAETQRDDALIAQSRALARDARTAIDAGDPTLGMLLALAALPRSLNNPDRPFVRDAEYPLANGFANRRERALLVGHEKIINAIAFSPDGTRVVTASDDNTARIWSVAGAARPIVLSGHTARVNSAAFSPDGARVVTASDDNSARLWDARTGAGIAVLSKHTGPVKSAVFSADGERIVTASWDMNAWTWDGRNGQPLVALIGHQDHVVAASFSLDGKRIATASDDKSARLWDAATGAVLWVLEGHQDSVNSAVFSPDGARVVTASDDKTARLWDANAGSQIAVLLGHAAGIVSAAFSPDGKRIVTASDDDTARIWSADTGVPERALVGHDGPVYSAVFSPNGSRVATASDDRTARLWDPESGAVVAVLGGHGAPVASALFSPDGATLATASREPVARLWNTETTAAVAILSGGDGAINSVAFSADGAFAVTAAGRTARLWNMKTRASIAVFAHEKIVHSAAFSPDGTLIVTASADHMARVWDARTGAILAVLRGHKGDVNAAAFSPDGARIVTASSDHTAFLWDAKSGAKLGELRGHDGAVDWAAFSPDGKRVVTASVDRTARLWDSKTGAQIAAPMQHLNIVKSAAFSPDGTQVVTASVDHSARLWDANTAALLLTLQGHGNYAVWSAAFSPDGKRIVTASDDRTARLWDVATGGMIAVLNGHQDTVSSAVFSPDGTQILTASADETARLWTVPPLCQGLIDAARKELPRELSPPERVRYFLEQQRPGGLSRFYDAMQPVLALMLPRAGDRCE